jgi:Arc/MetJ-type ribon-helix-helix transcriptional regulator
MLWCSRCSASAYASVSRKATKAVEIPNAGYAPEARKTTQEKILEELKNAAPKKPDKGSSPTDEPAKNRAVIRHTLPEQENQVAETLRSGACRSPDDVINRALEVLREQDEWLSANRKAIDAKIRRGIAQLDRGEGVPDDGLDDRLERPKAQPE